MTVAPRALWLSITVELIEGHGDAVWPRPGRIFAVSKAHTFGRFAVAIDDAFARWDRAHLHEFHLFEPGATFESRPRRVAEPDLDWDDDDEDTVPLATTKLAVLRPGQQFLYVFDLGDDWTHLCTVADKLIDPADKVGLSAAEMPGPLPYFGWGAIPDQYMRRWSGDDGENTRVPRDPGRGDLPPLRPWWGEGAARHR
jgi:Plasmid pRiA4b ORF-3-like protein